MSTSTRRLRRTSLALSALVVALALGACGGGGDVSTSDAGSAARAKEMPAPVAGPARDSAAGGDGLRYRVEQNATTDALSPALDGPQIDPVTQQRSVISTGVVSLRGDDVGQARFDVEKIVDTHGGEITDERTDTDKEGVVARSRLVIRVPVAEFDETMGELEQNVAELGSSSRTSEDVTTQVIDTEVRVRAQEKSLERIEVLLARARSIRDIVAIEAQLTRRQAELDSLKQQQAWLADQTSMSTITVHLEKKPDKAAAKKKDDTGFLAGFASGWHGLKAFTNGAATVLGALLPFAVVLLLVGVPLWYAGRRLLRQRSAPAPENEPAGA